uniref:C2H2-type domain-containing protein n=1 Tax=viral metagenome TaxID=1070528 RepID=A0A6C0HAK1_9ZZZZ
MDKKKTLKNSKKLPEYNCEFCDFKCCKKIDWDRHIARPKHIKNENDNKMVKNDNELTPKNSLFICDCGNFYKYQSGLSRHKKKCDTKNQEENITMDIEEPDLTEKSVPGNIDFSSDLILELLKQNQEFKELIIEQNKQMLEISKDRSITNNITQNNNNKFNLNVFLNETCKDALNLSDFLESLILTLTDFENFGPLGYCGGISNILIKGLNTLEVSKRPIHCSDLKREVIHIKNNDTWHKDDDKQQMIKVIKAIEHKNIKQMNLWAKANPEYKDPNNKKSELYTKLIDQSLSDTDKEKAQKNYNKIIRAVAKEILVEK